MILHLAHISLNKLFHQIFYPPLWHKVHDQHNRTIPRNLKDTIHRLLGNNKHDLSRHRDKVSCPVYRNRQNYLRPSEIRIHWESQRPDWCVVSLLDYASSLNYHVDFHSLHCYYNHQYFFQTTIDIPFAGARTCLCRKIPVFLSRLSLWKADLL